MKLGEVIRNLETAGDGLCIVAKRPWSADADADLVKLTDEFRVPASALAAGYEYFLEVSVALEEALGDASHCLSPAQRVNAVIFYAENDAYPEWLSSFR